jgi:general secretion pathway protein J
LIEVLIALAITALVASLAFASLDATISSVETLRERGNRITELNRAWNFFSRDIQHFVPRAIRNEFGNRESALYGGAAADQSLTFTRIGWHNTNARLRSHMQRVRYIVEDQTLYRESYPVLDRTSESEPRRVALLEGVLDFRLAFLGPGVQISGEQWDTEDWPENWGITSGSNSEVPAPQALELWLELDGWGELRWLYDLPQQ